MNNTQKVPEFTALCEWLRSQAADFIDLADRLERVVGKNFGQNLQLMNFGKRYVFTVSPDMVRLTLAGGKQLRKAKIAEEIGCDVSALDEVLTEMNGFAHGGRGWWRSIDNSSNGRH